MIKMANITKEYKMGLNNTVRALDNCSLEIEDGEIVFIVGKSGSGKSTLLHILGGLDKPTMGILRYDKIEITSLTEKKLSLFRSNNIGFVFQDYNLIPELTAKENIIYPVLLKRKKLDIELFNYLSETLELNDRLHHLPSQLSGGQQQRVAIARALIVNPKVVLCDEPTGNLDSHSSRMVQDILITLNHELKKTIIIVTHDNDFSNKDGRLIEICDGRII